MIAKRGAVLLVRNPCRREYERFQLRNCKKLKKVVLAEGTEKIVDKQFYGCKNLTTINIPKSVKIIEKNAFKGCPKLKL